MIVDGVIVPMELAHLPYQKATFEEYVGLAGLKRLGKKKWRTAVFDVVERLRAALEPGYCGWCENSKSWQYRGQRSCIGSLRGAVPGSRNRADRRT